MAHTAPVWKDKGEDPVLMSDLSDSSLNDYILRMHEGIHNQRAQILKRQQSISALQLVKENLEKEAERRGMLLGEG